MTLLIGRNNVGKTSVYAPLLLLRQTLQAKNPETALLLRGELVDFGSYSDVVTDHETALNLSFKLDLGLPGFFPGRNHSDRAGPRSLEITFEHSETHPARLVRSVVTDTADRPVVTRSLQASGSFRVTSPLLPANTEVGRPIREVTQLRRAMQAERPEGFLFSGVAGLRLPSDWRQDKERWNKVQGWYRAVSDIYDIYWSINSHIERALRRISYIGPLRSSPPSFIPRLCGGTCRRRAGWRIRDRSPISVES